MGARGTQFLAPSMFRFSSSRSAARAARRVAVAGCALLALLALALALAVQMFFESSERARLHAHAQQAREMLQATDSTAALAQLPERLQQRFGALPDVALRVQGAYGQTLYEQGAPVPQAALARAAAARPAPLLHWRDGGGRLWRGEVVQARVPLEGAALLTVALALEVQRQWLFGVRLAVALAAYVLLAGGALLWLARRAATPKEAGPRAEKVEPRFDGAS